MLDPDAKLMLQFKEGNKSCFEQLIKKYKNQVVNIIYQFIGERDEAEDLAIEVFLRVYKSAKNYQAKAKFSTYLYKITANLCINELKKRQRHRVISLDPSLLSDNRFPSPLNNLEQKEKNALIKKVIDDLPSRQRMAIILQVYEELSYKEISKILSCSIKSVERLLYRAKLNLKKKLNPYLKSEKTGGF